MLTTKHPKPLSIRTSYETMQPSWQIRWYRTTLLPIVYPLSLQLTLFSTQFRTILLSTILIAHSMLKNPSKMISKVQGPISRSDRRISAIEELKVVCRQ